MKDLVSPKLTPESLYKRKLQKGGQIGWAVFEQAWKILDELLNKDRSQLETGTRNICTSENYKKEVKWVNPVFNQVWKILAQLHNEGLIEPKTNTRIICTSENYKKEFKSVKPAFKPGWKILGWAP